MTKKTILEIITALLVCLWTYAAISKFLDHYAFVLQLKKSPLLGPFRNFLSIGLPLMELLIVVALFTKKFRQIGLYSSAFLLVIFSVYLTAVLKFSEHIPCNCGGIIGKGWNWKTHIAFNLVFAGLAFIGARLRNNTQNDTTARLGVV